MKIPLRSFTAALGFSLVALSTASFAQSAAAESGLIGKRYAGADFTYDHFTGSSLDHAMGATARVNVPFSQAVDLGLSYSYVDATGANASATDRALAASWLTHRPTEYGTGYFGASLGHAWHRLGGPAARRDNGAFWGVRAGYEFSVAPRTALNAGLGFSDAFDQDNARGQVVRASLEANHWFSAEVAGVVSASYAHVRKAPDSITYTAGLRWAF